MTRYDLYFIIIVLGMALSIAVMTNGVRYLSIISDVLAGDSAHTEIIELYE